MKQNLHGRLIAAAAKRHLSPLGCRRKGQSRFWSADHGFHQIGIEFQPSGWSKGSYLNVGVQWLFYPKPYFTFDTGYRTADFVPFMDEAQFAPEADRLAAHAAGEVQRLRAKFHSLAAVAHHLKAEPLGLPGWSNYYAAVAAGLIGEITEARTLFNCIPMPSQDDWCRQRRTTAMQLASCLGDATAYHGAVLALIGKCRALQKLPPDMACLDPKGPDL